jgi:transcriptional regulator GlxA family with amidase domain
MLTIALACGFAGLGQFYRCFNQRFGCAPRRYRAGFRRV